MARCVECHQSTNKHIFKELPNESFCDCYLSIAKNKIIAIEIKNNSKKEIFFKENINLFKDYLLSEIEEDISVRKWKDINLKFDSILDKDFDINIIKKNKIISI